MTRRTRRIARSYLQRAFAMAAFKGFTDADGILRKEYRGKDH